MNAESPGGPTDVERVDHDWRLTRAGFLMAWGVRGGIVPSAAVGLAVAVGGAGLGVLWACWLAGDMGVPRGVALFVGLVAVLGAVASGTRQVGRAWAYRAAEREYHRRRLEAVRREAAGRLP